MTIRIHRPELEALIRQRMETGGFDNVEDALQQALEAWIVDGDVIRSSRTGADLIAAMQSSPFREIEIEPRRFPMPVRDVSF